MTTLNNAGDFSDEHLLSFANGNLEGTELGDAMLQDLLARPDGQVSMYVNKLERLEEERVNWRVLFRAATRQRRDEQDK